MELEQLLSQAVASLDRHKAEDLLALQVSALTSIADCFLIASGTSATQVRSLADYLEDDLRRAGVTPCRSEGYRAGEWITLDYGDLIVHLFRRETRAFYDLERLWSDARRWDITPFMMAENENLRRDHDDTV